MGQREWVENMCVENVGPGRGGKVHHRACGVRGRVGFEEDEGGEVQALRAVALGIAEEVAQLVEHLCSRFELGSVSEGATERSWGVYTEVISKLSGWISGARRSEIAASSCNDPTGIKTRNPLRSSSIATDFVIGECGDPASTTNSVFAPFGFLLARRFWRCSRLWRHTRKVLVPKNATIAAVRALFRSTHAPAR